MAVIHVGTENFKAEVLESEKPVVVDFFATWCGPCQQMGSILEEISEETEAVKLCKLDIDEAMEIAKEYHVMSVPTFILFKGGEVAKRMVGGMPKEDFLEFAGL